jgi:hypothetical protein
MTLAALGRILVLCLCCYAGSLQAEPRPYYVDIQITTPGKDGEYYVSLLNLILNASKAPDEVIEFRFANHSLSQARWVAAVVQDRANNVLWTMTNKEREQSMRAIRVPLLKGLIGYRLLVIRKEDEAKFAKINTKEELLALSAGQGMHWPDTEILRSNHFSVTEAMAKENLYKMLAAKRFDFFPRGVTEVSLEAALIRSQGLMVEPRLVLHYPAALYFFVNKNNTDLAQRLEKGFAILQKNGEFDKLFLSAERIKSALAILKQPNRKIIELENPLLPSDTPLNIPKYWLNLSGLP